MQLQVHGDAYARLLAECCRYCSIEPERGMGMDVLYQGARTDSTRRLIPFDECTQ